MAGPPLNMSTETRPMRVTVNGNTDDYPDNLSLLELVTRLELDPARVVVEHNRDIVKAAALATTTVHDNDEVELLQFVGGG